MPPAAQLAYPRRLAFAVCWTAVAAGGAGLIGWLVQVWRAHPDTADRLLIILAAVWLVCRRRDVLAGPRSPTWCGLRSRRVSRNSRSGLPTASSPCISSISTRQ